MEELERINEDLMVLLAYMNRDIERINEELAAVDMSFQELDAEVLDLETRLNWVYENYAFTNRIDELEAYTDQLARSMELIRNDLHTLGFVPERLEDIDNEFIELREEFDLIEDMVDDFVGKSRIAVTNLETKVELAREMQRETGEIKEQVQTLTADVNQVKQHVTVLTQDLQTMIKNLEHPPPDTRIHAYTNDKPAQPLPKSYTSAKSAYYNRRFEQAIRMFEDFIAQHPSDPLAANSQYWMAESYYAAGNYRKALREFETVILRYPFSPKAADAQVKIGLCHIQLKNMDMARTELRKVRSQYPGYERQALVDSLLNRIGN